jgi:hypothetical protein
MAHSVAHWQLIGWDGITVRVPPHWQPTVILRDYLFFEHEGRPVLEVKWQYAGRRFAPDRVLGKIGKTLRQGRSELREWNIPPALQETVSRFTVTGFQFREGPYDSRGLLLFCPICRRATLLRFYTPPHEEGPAMDQVLASFSDHPGNRDRLWAVYDISALLPAEAELQAHEFLVGRYTLTFSLDRSVLTLFRFKPAAALLRNRDLSAFGAPLAGPARSAGSDDPGSFTWMEAASGSQRLLRRLQRKPVWTWLKLWHVQEENVILGIKGEGKQLPPATEIMEHIYHRYTARQAV